MIINNMDDVVNGLNNSFVSVGIKTGKKNP